MEGALEKEKKACGHFCYPSSTEGCCSCMDLRPLRDGDTYPTYRDGEGWVDIDSRDAGYCPICNPKNYEVWKEKIEIERTEKMRLKQLLIQDFKTESDKRRAAACVSVTAAAAGDGDNDREYFLTYFDISRRHQKQ